MWGTLIFITMARFPPQNYPKTVTKKKVVTQRPMFGLRLHGAPLHMSDVGVLEPASV